MCEENNLLSDTDSAIAASSDVEEPIRGLAPRVPEGVRYVIAGPNVGVKQVSDKIWLVSFMHYDLGYFDHETCRLEPIENPFSPKVLPMSPV